MKTDKNQGTLFLVPTPLIDGQIQSLPTINSSIIRECKYFLVESLKLGRRHVKNMVTDFDFTQASFSELSKKTEPDEWELLLTPALEGQNVCILSDAGSPVIADPGSNIVKMAHHKGISVVPLSGPSSVMLALMASGFSGQQFTFHGYLPRDKHALRNVLKKLEQEVRSGYTQIFMETPYRNIALFDQMIQLLADPIPLCIACDLTSELSFVSTKTIKQWRKKGRPDINKRPCIFLLGQ